MRKRLFGCVQEAGVRLAGDFVTGKKRVKMGEMTMAFDEFVIFHFTQSALRCDRIRSKPGQGTLNLASNCIMHREDVCHFGCVGQTFAKNREVESGIDAVELIVTFDQPVLGRFRRSDNETSVFVALEVIEVKTAHVAQERPGSILEKIPIERVAPVSPVMLDRKSTRL